MAGRYREIDMVNMDAGLAMLVAETLIDKALDMMPRNHPDSAIWARYLGDAAREVSEAVKSRRVGRAQ